MGRQAYLTRVCLVSTDSLWVTIMLFICHLSSMRFYVRPQRLKTLVNFLPYFSIHFDAEKLEELISVLHLPESKQPASRTHI